MQRFLLVAAVQQLVPATVSDAAKGDIRHHRVVLLVRRGCGHLLERGNRRGVARAIIHQAVDAARRFIQLHRVDSGGQGRSRAEDAHASARVEHLAAGEAQLSHELPDAFGDGLGGVILVGAALLAVGADERAAGAGILRQNQLFFRRQARRIHFASVDATEQSHRSGVVLLALGRLAVRVKLVILGRLVARRRRGVIAGGGIRRRGSFSLGGSAPPRGRLGRAQFDADLVRARGQLQARKRVVGILQTRLDAGELAHQFQPCQHTTFSHGAIEGDTVQHVFLPFRRGWR